MNTHSHRKKRDEEPAEQQELSQAESEQQEPSGYQMTSTTTVDCSEADYWKLKLTS